MQADFTEVTFNKNHKQESRGLQALNGMRLVLLSFMLYAFALAAFLAMTLAPQALTDALGILATATFWIGSLAGFATGAYGTYLVVDALDWAKFIGFIIIASFLVPYFRMFALLVIAALALDLVSKSGYRLSLFGKPVKRQ